MVCSKVYVLDDQKQVVMVVGQRPIDIEPQLENITSWVFIHVFIVKELKRLLSNNDFLVIYRISENEGVPRRVGGMATAAVTLA